MKLDFFDKDLDKDKIKSFDMGGQNQMPQQVKKHFDLEAGRKTIELFKAETAKLFNRADNFEVKSDADMATATEMIGQSKTLANTVEEAAKTIYRPYYDFYKSMLNIKNSVVDPLKKIPANLKRKTDQYAYQVEMDRRAAEAAAREKAEAFQKKLEAEAKKKKIKAPVIPPPVQVAPEKMESVKTESGTMKVEMVWDYEIENYRDPGLLEWVLRSASDEYLKAVNKAMKIALRDGVHEGVPGIKFFERADTQHRKR